ncbi:hypothetical protein [Knoellia sp. p5-6-4]|uniref:hypothetical protein n=1 Tax=unclassified Knoellia TaxID=2618719 RepID=UPI0023DC4EF9|nr:hypothetical protein [Knoellia sp. p5-6-4]MDF2146856.1 hypothetical protein [Knoellia sp. p5-6-4]
MIMRADEAARRRFGDDLALYDLRALDSKSLVHAATDLLVSGVEGPAVVALASAVVTPVTSPFEMDALVLEAREELGMSQLDQDQTAIRASQSQLRRWLAGELTDRQLAAWAHGVIGHDGPSILQDLVVTDDMLDELEYIAATTDSIHRDLQDIAQRLLAYADPWGA